jgi:hypothetical protein
MNHHTLIKKLIIELKNSQIEVEISDIQKDCLSKPDTCTKRNMWRCRIHKEGGVIWLTFFGRLHHTTAMSYSSTNIDNETVKKFSRIIQKVDKEETELVVINSVLLS